jgi:hypothetical protein
MIASCKYLKAACSSGPQRGSSDTEAAAFHSSAAFTLDLFRQCFLKRGQTLLVVGYRASHPVDGSDILYQIVIVLRLAHRLKRVHILRVEAYTILCDKPFEIRHHGCKQYTIAGVNLRFIALALLEVKLRVASKSSSVVVLSRQSSNLTLMLLLMLYITKSSTDCRSCVALFAACCTRVGVYTLSGVMKDWQSSESLCRGICQ